MSDSHQSTAEKVKDQLADVQLDGSETDSTASTTTPVGSVDSTDPSTSLTFGLPPSQTPLDEHLAAHGEPVASSSNAGAEERPLDGMVTRSMLEAYLQKLLKNIPLTTEETKYLCDRVRLIFDQV